MRDRPLAQVDAITDALIAVGALTSACPRCGGAVGAPCDQHHQTTTYEFDETAIPALVAELAARGVLVPGTAWEWRSWHVPHDRAARVYITCADETDARQRLAANRLWGVDAGIVRRRVGPWEDIDA